MFAVVFIYKNYFSDDSCTEIVEKMGKITAVRLIQNFVLEHSQ